MGGDQIRKHAGRLVESIESQIQVAQRKRGARQIIRQGCRHAVIENSTLRIAPDDFDSPHPGQRFSRMRIPPSRLLIRIEGLPILALTEVHVCSL